MTIMEIGETRFCHLFFKLKFVILLKQFIFTIYFPCTPRRDLRIWIERGMELILLNQVMFLRGKFMINLNLGHLIFKKRHLCHFKTFSNSGILRFHLRFNFSFGGYYMIFVLQWFLFSSVVWLRLQFAFDVVIKKKLSNIVSLNALPQK